MTDDEATEDIEEVWSDTDSSDDIDTKLPQEEHRELQKAIQTLRDEQEKLINVIQTIRDDQTKCSQENKKIVQQNNTLVKRNTELQKRNLKLRQDRDQMKFDGMATFWMFVRSRLPEFKAGTFDIEQLKSFEQLLDEFLKSRMPLKDKFRIISLRQVSSVQVEGGHRQNGCLDNIGEQLERLVNDEAKKALTRHIVLLKEARKVASEAKKRHDVLLNKALQDVHAAQKESDSTRQALQSANHRIQELVEALHALQAKYDALTTEHTALHTTHDNLQSTYDALLLQIQHDTQARYAKKLTQLESELEYAHNKFQMTMNKYGPSTSNRYKEWHRQIVADIEDRIRKHKAKGPT